MDGVCKNKSIFTNKYNTVGCLTIHRLGSVRTLNATWFLAKLVSAVRWERWSCLCPVYQVRLGRFLAPQREQLLPLARQGRPGPTAHQSPAAHSSCWSHTYGSPEIPECFDTSYGSLSMPRAQEEGSEKQQLGWPEVMRS